MNGSITISKKQADVLRAFLDSYELRGPGWPGIEQGMREDFGVQDPETDLENAREALFK